MGGLKAFQEHERALHCPPHRCVDSTVIASLNIDKEHGLKRSDRKPIQYISERRSFEDAEGS